MSASGRAGPAESLLDAQAGAGDAAGEGGAPPGGPAGDARPWDALGVPNALAADVHADASGQSDRPTWSAPVMNTVERAC